MSETNTVLNIVQNLAGAASRSFYSMFPSPALNTWSIPTLRAHLLELIPNYQTTFAKKVLDMSFRAQFLADDVRKYQLLLTHSNIPTTPTFVYDQLKEKLLEGVPQFLQIAVSDYGLRFDLESTDNTTTIISKALKIITTVAMRKPDAFVQDEVSPTKPIKPSLKPPFSERKGDGAGGSKTPRDSENKGGKGGYGEEKPRPSQARITSGTLSPEEKAALEQKRICMKCGVCADDIPDFQGGLLTSKLSIVRPCVLSVRKRMVVC